MPILLKAASGLVAGAMVGALSVAVWPRIEPAVSNAHAAVEQPKFVSNGSGSAGPTAAAAIVPSGADKEAMEKLALALRSGASPTGVSEADQSDQGRRLRAQGLVALADGDVAGARAYLERAAESGDARALLVLGDTYDPATLTRMGALGLKGDPARARDYYARALSAGVSAARDRIAAREEQQN
jgi:hypothetical protein